MIAALVGACAAHALEPTTPLANLNRQGWVMENGLPQNTIHALAQTADGFLWLGTEVGLVRFDGVNFATFDEHSKPALPSGDIRCLLAAKDGSLWIGTGDGLARMKDGAVTTYTTKDGLPGNAIRAVAQDMDGVVWAWADTRLARLIGDRFVVAGSSGEPHPTNILSVQPMDSGLIWVNTEKGLQVRTHGHWDMPGWAVPGPEFNWLVELKQERGAFVSAARIVLEHATKPFGSMAVGRELPGTRIQTVYADHEGSLWIGTNGGLVRYANGKLEKFPLTDPLATASVLSILEDREGNLWVGTESSGLQILRDARFQTLTTRDGLAGDNTTTVVQDRAGTMWVGTAGNGVMAFRAGGDQQANRMRVRAGTPAPQPAGRPALLVVPRPVWPGPARTYSVRDGLTSDVILSLAAAPNGDVWVGTPDGLNRIRGSAVDAYTSFDGLPDDFIRSLLVDADGSLWVGTRHGLAHMTFSPGSGTPARIDTYTQADGLGSDLVGAMTRDGNQDLWVATLNGLSRLHRDGAKVKITNYTTADGLSSNVVTTLLARANGALLIGTQDHGWNEWNGSHFSPVTGGGLKASTIRAILDDGREHLWFATANGIARCDCSSAMGPMEGAGCSHWMEFSTADGLRSRETAVNSHPSAWKSADGRLWFATPKGLVEVDPARFPVNMVPPPVTVERFAVDDADQALHAADMKIPAGHNHFQIEYAALSFVAPQKVRYRYMLEGFDHNWTDAGARRTAYYTNIPPGHYTFRVQAANNDGVWNTTGAKLEFDLEPHFYQTLWFYVLLSLAVLGLVLLALRLRLMRAEREFRAVLGERNRIAREIHDTLAQGYVGISVQLEVMSELLRQKKLDAAAEHLDTTRGIVREGLKDARQSIWALRSQDTGETTLPVKLRRATEQAGGRGLEAHFNVHGAYRPLPPGTENEIVRVAQEALHNVKKHAGARTVNVQLEYLQDEIALEVRDDGRGFETNGAGERVESPAGHYGLTGMRERAMALGGTLELVSAPGAGVTVRLRAPAPRGAREEKEQV